MNTEMINSIKIAGFDVYMRNTNDTYCFFTDGTNIGYMQESYFQGGYDLSTVHVANIVCGTSFSIERECHAPITREQLLKAFAVCPSWFHGKMPTKFKDFAYFHNHSDFNKKLVKV